MSGRPTVPTVRVMRPRGGTEHVVPFLVIGGALAAVPLATMHFFAKEKVQFTGEFHFTAVGLTAAVAAVAAVALTIVGARRGDCRTVLVGTAFSAMAALLALHGIATPGVLVGYNGLVAFTGGATLPVGGDLVAAEESFLGAHVRSLTVRLAEKDEYTEEHTRRVALRAVQVGEELGLSPGRVRALATGGLVHDIGKLSVPDAILKKAGPLTDEEFVVVKRHAESGDRMLRDLGFKEEVRQLVRSHHERLDGSGYPWTAPAIHTASPGLACPSTCGSSQSATSTTRSSRSASTARPGHTSGRSRSSARRAAPRSTRSASRPSSVCSPASAGRA
jgi:putative nucleotidyltransferase with HDIG domain